MKSRIASFCLVLCITVLVVVGFRLFLLAQYPKPINEANAENKRLARSPNNDYEAFISTYEDVDFWGRHSFFYQIDINQLGQDKPIRILRVYPSEGDPLYDFTETGKFVWDSDSLGVDVGFFGAELRLQAIENQ